jgi:hypothetical protein
MPLATNKIRLSLRTTLQRSEAVSFNAQTKDFGEDCFAKRRLATTILGYLGKASLDTAQWFLWRPFCRLLTLKTASTKFTLKVGLPDLQNIRFFKYLCCQEAQ